MAYLTHGGKSTMFDIVAFPTYYIFLYIVLGSVFKDTKDFK